MHKQEILPVDGRLVVYWHRTVGVDTVYTFDGVDYWPTLRQALDNAAGLTDADDSTYVGFVP